MSERPWGETFCPPPCPTYETDAAGIPTGRKMVWLNVSGGAHRWRWFEGDLYLSSEDKEALARMERRQAVEEGYETRTPVVRYMRRTDEASA